MKILIVSGSLVFDNLGGSEMQMRTLGGYLLEQGHEVVYYFREFVPEKPSQETQEGATVYRNERPHGQVLGLMRDAERLREIVRKEAPGVLYARCFRSVFVLGRVSRQTDVPFVYQVPFALDSSFFGLAQLKHIRKSLPLTFYGFLSQRALKHATQLLTISLDDADALMELRGLDARTIYNMHPIPDAPISKTAPPLVVWINNIKSIKRPDLFVDLASRCHDTRARFIMSGRMGHGRADQGLRRRIEATRNLDYIGPTTLDEANALLAEATVNVVTSRSEGFPNGTIQGWLRETPTITTVDKDQVITRNRIGFHASSVDEMEGKLRFLLDHPDECAAMGRRAREYAIENHSIESQGPKYEAALMDVIE